MARGPIWRRSPSNDPTVRLNLDGLESRDTPATVGVPDPSFAGTGEIVLAGTPINDVATQPDGKVIAVGSSNGDFLIQRFNADGTVDTSFGSHGTGKVVVDVGIAGQQDVATSVKLDPAGKIIVAGTGGSVAGEFALVRLTADGKIVEVNKSYAVGTGASGAAGVDYQVDGTIVVAGTATNPDTGDTDMTVLRIDPNGGTIVGDPIFVANPGADTAAGVAVYHSQPHQDRIVVVGTVAGQSDDDFAVARLNADGTPDNTFHMGTSLHRYNLGGAGDVARGVAIDRNNNIVVVGNTRGPDGTSDIAVIRVLSTNSNLDGSFNLGSPRIISGAGDEAARDVAVQPDGRIVIVGDTRSATAMPTPVPPPPTPVPPVTGEEPGTGEGPGTGEEPGDGGEVGDGSGDEPETPVPPVVPPPTLPPTTATNGNVVLVRLNADGSLDGSLAPGGVARFDVGTDDRGRAVAIAGSGRVVLAGTSGNGGFVTRVTGSLEPTGTLAVGGSTDGRVTLYSADPNTGAYDTRPVATLPPLAPQGVEVRTATADVDGDGTADTIMVTGPGTAIRVQVISGRDHSTVLVSPFDPFGGDFKGGGFVTAADFDNDGRADIVVTPDKGGGPRVVVFSLMDRSLVSRVSFLGIRDTGFRGGARAAAGDVNGDGTPDLVVTAGFQGGPRVSVYDGQTLYWQSPPAELVRDFFAFDPVLRNGAYAAVGDVNGDGYGDLVFGAGPGGAPHIRVVSGAKLIADGPEEALANPLANFFAGKPDANRGGVRVAVKDVDGDHQADLVVGTGEKQPSQVRFYLGTDVDGATRDPAAQLFDPFGRTLPNGVFVG